MISIWILISCCAVATAAAAATAVAGQGSPFTWVSGILAITTGGLGGWLIRNLKTLGDLKNAIEAYIQVPAAISVFSKSVGPKLASDPDYINMLKKLDYAFEDTAAVLQDLGLPLQAQMLRDVIQANGNQYSINTIFKDVDIGKALKTALDSVKK